MQIWTSFQSTLLGDWIKSTKSQACKFFIKAAEGNASMCKANEFYKEFVFVQTNCRITSRITSRTVELQVPLLEVQR